MYQIEPLASAAVQDFQTLYEQFKKTSKDEYHWELDPIGFDILLPLVQQKLIEGYLISDLSCNQAVGFMLFRQEEHRVIEINLIFSIDSIEPKAFLDTLIRHFLKEIETRPGWEVISYAMLGVQWKFIRTITWYGFKPVGQTIQRFDLMDEISLQILHQQHFPELPEGYEIQTWNPAYAGETAQTICEAFEKSADALWDPRFKTLLGCKKVVAAITQHEMGKHLPSCSSVLLKNGLPIGVCFLSETDLLKGNIPIVAIRPAEKKQKLGARLLHQTLMNTVHGVINATVTLFEISATMETDNIPAIKLYRQMGFKETVNYAHVYATRTRLQERAIGDWC